VVYDLIGDNLGILIGKHGQTLDSLQYLVNLTANRGNAENRVHIILDIEGYRARREETLMRLAGHLAEKACRIGDEVHLEPMNRHERKIIHMALQDNRRVSTYSAGDEPRRYVVIAPRRRRRRRDYDRENYGEE
jgi:spoIIIJ-associated protein